MPSVSIVIVNYNVRHFLSNCLDSIEKSITTGLQIETIVVDNHSIDGSVQAIKQKYPWVTLIENKENLGFGKANNQGFAIARGQYILALNPDTILQEDTLQQCFLFMENHADCGVLGVKMIDGSGTYLPESKRGTPGLWNAFCKFSGLSALFPNSRIWAGYYMGHLSADDIQEVDVLCGAFMFFKAEALSATKGFDEDFFMYGEDIDLSIRIKNAGWKVMYFPNTRIIHFKGESSKKASFNYILHFYQSMSIFVGKHYKGWRSAAFKLFIRVAILVTALVSYLKHNVADHFRKIVDLFLLIGVQSGLKQVWAVYYFNNPDYYSNLASIVHTVGTSLLWVFFMWFFGHYDHHWKPRRQWAGILLGTAVILMVYSMLPSDWRSSRFLILAGAVFALILTRLSQNLAGKFNRLLTGKSNRQHYLIVARHAVATDIAAAIKSREPEAKVEGFLYPSSDVQYDSSLYLGSLQNLREIVDLYKTDNIVFSADDIPMQRILDLMIHPDKEVRYLITGGTSAAVVGSDTSSGQGKFYHAESSFRLSQGLYIRLKRGLDLGIAILILVLFPFTWLFFGGSLLLTAWQVFVGKLTWIGYSSQSEADDQDPFLPAIKQGRFTTRHLILNTHFFPVISTIQEANIFYAKNYSPMMDLHLLYKEIFSK